MPWHLLNNFTAALLALGLLMFIAVMGDYFLRGPHRLPIDPVWQLPDTDPQRGRDAIIAHGCGACHTIPGIRTADGRVGPQLADLRNQIYIAGHLPNTPDNLAHWLQAPRDIRPGTAMPNLGVTEQEARDIAAYLYTATIRTRAPEDTPGPDR
ncbi:cytochrome c family protein [Phycisphaerales bacterium AB-hyl4]|uniref:Cytochrome c family protein n=1 Tax=Natronomicrosphaera hydrolytica TaxID=3242702 RepID=A0ABV4U4H5_9BACT